MPSYFHRAVARATLTLLALAASASAALAQSPLVLQRGSSREFHNPWCPLVRDGKDVLALTRAQASARGLMAHPGCAEESGREAAKPAAPPLFVQVDGSKYYHRPGCRRLGGGSKRVPLPAAAKTRWPCPACRPPIRKSGS